MFSRGTLNSVKVDGRDFLPFSNTLWYLSIFSNSNTISISSIGMLLPHFLQYYLYCNSAILQFYNIDIVTTTSQANK